MLEQVNKYLLKLRRHGLVQDANDAALYGLDDEIYTNRSSVPEEVRELFKLLNINSLIIARPEPVIRTVIPHLTEGRAGLIRPCDCESLTFIHDIPVVPRLDPGPIARALNRRKGCIVEDTGIVTIGTVSLEQAFIVLSSFCFAGFVKFFADTLNGLYGYSSAPHPGSGRVDAALELLGRVVPRKPLRILPQDVSEDEASITEAMNQAGKAVVEAGLVDSFFGNVSYRAGDTVYISQTGSSLDELPGHIDRVAMDGSSTCEITSSSELMAHIRTYELTQDNAILHGHPRFSVIMSMFGEPLEFGSTRYIEDIPVVSGEVGAGRHGLLHTLPPALKASHRAVVSGHGTFTSCTGSFARAFEEIIAVESLCFRACSETLQGPRARMG